MQLFGTSGIRRPVDSELVRIAFQVGFSVGAVYHNVVIGRDTRTSGDVLRHAVVAGILASGAGCFDAGIVPTPTLAFATQKFAAGIMITASHNPPQYNGLKLFNPDGSAFADAQQKEIETLTGQAITSVARWDKMMSGVSLDNAVELHTDRVMQDFSAGLRLRVVVDAGCGAAYFITPSLLTRLGCEVIPLNCHPNGVFPRDAEPTEASLGELSCAVKESGAAVGIAHDGDADRAMAVDERGRFISGDRLLCILAQAYGAREIVTTIDASMCLEEMGSKVRRTKVGDPYVAEELKKGGEFGGEPSGAWIFPKVSLCPDGVYAAAMIATLASREKLSDLADSIPSYPVIRGNIAAPATAMPEIKQRLVAELKPAVVDTIDGVKLYFEDGWLLVRSSGTEPKVRISAEGKNETTARRLFDSGTRIVRSVLGSS
ncbi:MAG: phosphoglucosamine mutase [Chloroflexi bacterium]|nr:phosphoglucosamine mutase [Chloroflexota bacterium]